jgi:hypothetical protein
MAQSFRDTRYPAKVWAGTASAAILAVMIAASLWVFFGQGNPLAQKQAFSGAAVHAGLIP